MQARARAMASDRAMARTTDRPRLRARAMVSSRARARAWECVYVQAPGAFCRWTKFNVTEHLLGLVSECRC